MNPTLLQTAFYTDALKSLADRNPEYVSLLSLAQSTKGPQSTAAMKTLADSMVGMLKNLREQVTQVFTTSWERNPQSGKK